MQRRTFLAAGSAAALAAASGGATQAFAATPGTNASMSSNPLLQPWTGPYGGVPAFDKVKVALFKPALEEAMAAQRAEIDAIANNPAPPTFDNTIVAMERSGRPLTRVFTYWGIWSGNLSTPDFQAVETEMSPILAKFGDEITQNTKLFGRIEAVYNSPEKAKLTAEQQRLVWSYWNQFVREGAKLDPAAKAEVTELNQRLSVLYAKFGQNLQHDEANYVIYLKDEDTAGLPAPFKAALAQAAKDKNRPGEYAVTNTRSSMDPFLTYSDRRDLREKVWRTYYNRGDNGDQYDNNAIITEILQLRFQRANLLGFPTHAHWRVADQMAKTPENAMSLMMRVWPSAVARVHQEVAEMQQVADSEKAGIKIAPWDYRYYAEKVRKAKYDLDLNEVKPYLQLEKIREAMFWCAGQLYGFKFTQIHGVPVFDPEMTVYEVTGRNGQHVGVWYFDPYAREGKNSGAWMNAYREQEKFERPIATIVSNNANFVKGAPGEPVLISWDDAITMFHEFGHALHGLNSNVNYPRLSGTNVPRDFVEYPSQLNENWLPTPEVMGRFLVHYKTGQPLPQALRDKIKKAETFRKGFDVTEYLASAIVDMRYHLAGGGKIDPDAFERDTLKELGMPDELPMRHRSPQFAHVFSGDGYSAGYYSYLWAEVLDHDTFEAFLEEGGPFNKTTAKRYHDEIVSVGNTRDPAESYRRFRGRDPDVKAYLRSKGFPTTTA